MSREPRARLPGGRFPGATRDQYAAAGMLNSDKIDSVMKKFLFFDHLFGVVHSEGEPLLGCEPGTEIGGDS